jgi:hypothetical protein
LKVKSGKYQVSPWIYGLGDYRFDKRASGDFWSLNPSLVRWGGNIAERYNPFTGAWNTGSDWFFMNVTSSKRPVVEHMVEDQVKHGSASAVTIPLLGWVSKDTQSVSFPKAKFSQQQRFENNAGNGLDKSGKPISTSPELTSIKFTPDQAREWVKTLKEKMKKGPHFYIIGNEPMLWNSTHRDVHPEPASYDEVATKYIAMAKAVREADPDAIILGPALWGWLAMERSALDLPGPHNGNRRDIDRNAHGGKPFLRWFLDQVVAEERKIGKSLIDAIDVHFYPENSLVRDKSKASTDNARLARIESTRSLWDPDYKDDSWIAERIRLIPRLQEYASVKPNLGVCIGEYNFYGEDDIGGGVALAEVIGIFAREKLACAAYWTYPPKDSPAAAAFRLLTNFDGKGTGLGSVLIRNNIEIGSDDSVLTTWDPSSKQLRMLVINKSAKVSKVFKMPVSSFSKSNKATTFAITADKPSTIIESSMIVQESIEVRTPPMSMSLVVLPGVEI